jgi:hypothetical protein
VGGGTTAGHYHRHNNNRDKDSPAAPGTGSTGFNNVMLAVQKSAVVPVIEVPACEKVIQSLEYIRAL